MEKREMSVACRYANASQCEMRVAYLRAYRKRYISVAENSPNENDARSGGGENEITYRTTTALAYRTLFKMTKVLARSRPLAVVNGSRVPSKSEISLAGT